MTTAKQPTPMSAKLDAPNYTQVPNVLLDNLNIVSDAELRVLLVIIRQTIGWHRQRHKLSISFLAQATDMSTQGVINATKSLVSREVIARHPAPGGFEYELLLNDASQRRREAVVNAVDSQRRGEVPVNAVDKQPVNAVGTNKERVLKKGKKGTRSASVRVSEEEKTKAGEIYELYPRKVGRPAAIKSIAKILRSNDFAQVKERTQAFAVAWQGGDLTYCPHPATWFNQERFNDPPEEWTRTKREPSRETAKKEGGATPSGPQEF